MATPCCHDRTEDARRLDTTWLILAVRTAIAGARAGTLERGRSNSQRVRADAAEPLQSVADPVAAALEAALVLRRSGAGPKALRRALRGIEELLDE